MKQSPRRNGWGRHNLLYCCPTIRGFRFFRASVYFTLHTSHMFPVSFYSGRQGDCSTKSFIEYQCGPSSGLTPICWRSFERCFKSHFPRSNATMKL